MIDLAVGLARRTRPASGAAKSTGVGNLMSNEAITEKPRANRENRPHLREMAPSILREDEPRFVRFVFFIALGLALLGLMAIARFAMGGKALISLGWGSFFFVIGLLGVLLHASSDKDMQVRRTYSVFGFLLLAAGAVLSLISYQGEVGGLFWLGFLCMAGALLFILASIRNETEESWRNRVTAVLGAAGAIMALTGFIGGNVRQGEFLVPHGFLLALLGLGYLWAFVGLRGTSDELGYRVGLGIGLLGALVCVIALARSALPPVLFSWHWLKTPPQPYWVPIGFILVCLGLLYAGMSAGTCSDNRLAVMTRRELAGFFYSPMAYIILVGLTFLAWIFFAFWFLPEVIILSQPNRVPLVEPIVQHFVFDLVPVICMIFIVPALTMRLLSEEKRTGTLEVLLTAPVNERTVVLSKFLASLLFFTLTWVPWALFLVALRIEGKESFDYRPMLSFLVALIFMGAGFMGMGLFFSSLTRNQVASGVLTFSVMLLFLILWIIKIFILGRQSPDSLWIPVLGHICYGELWSQSLQGQLDPRLLTFHLSSAILWLFMTVKVLEARRWT
jgi:ABC-type transport system involved in multi-copper enzyme maturation permease subunit